MQPFLGSSDGHGNVVFNFQGSPVGDLSAFAHGYHEAAKVLAERLHAAAGYADYEGYPILFLYRHALELYLKAVVYRGAMLLHLVSEATAPAVRGSAFRPVGKSRARTSRSNTRAMEDGIRRPGHAQSGWGRDWVRPRGRAAA